MKKDYDSTKIYRKTQKKGASQTYDTPSWRKYLTTRSYFGRDLCVTPLHVSYGQIGYTIHFPYSRAPMPELAYDWEMNELTIDEEDWQKWLADEDEEDDDSEDAIPE